jgi:hypothetical protein
MSSRPKTTELDSHIFSRTLPKHSQSPTLPENVARRLSSDEVAELVGFFDKMRMDVSHAAALAKDEEEFHCARCHNTYLERDNAENACCLKHEVSDDSSKHGDGNTGHCRFCGETAIEDGAGDGVDWPDDGICYEGRHTSDPDDVDYEGDNALTCEEVGCPGHEELHCVRCHWPYFPLAYNGDGCCIGHKHDLFDRDPERVGDTYRYTCKSCGKHAAKDEEGKEVAWAEWICFEGKHTANTEDVEYDGIDTMTCEANCCLLVKEH